MGQQYAINFANNSINGWSACVFQQDENIGQTGVMSLAWFAKKCNPATKCNFNWTIDYSFVWAETGVLVPGVNFSASQTVAAGLTSNNLITFDNNGAFLFEGQGTATPAGSLYIDQTPNIPLYTASVGIGMSGSGTFAVQAQPNINATFTPHPKYWMAFGQFTPGDVLDIQQMSNIVEIDFPANVYTMYVTFNADNSWTVSQSPSVSVDKSAQLMSARKK